MRFDFIYQKFYKGERVKYIRKKGGLSKVVQYGETGTVLEDGPLMIGSLIPVNWDKENDHKYSLLGCPNCHGWAVEVEDLEKIL